MVAIEMHGLFEPQKGEWKEEGVDMCPAVEGIVGHLCP